MFWFFIVSLPSTSVTDNLDIQVIYDAHAIEFNGYLTSVYISWGLIVKKKKKSPSARIVIVINSLNNMRLITIRMDKFLKK